QQPRLAVLPVLLQDFLGFDVGGAVLAALLVLHAGSQVAMAIPQAAAGENQEQAGTGRHQHVPRPAAYRLVHSTSSPLRPPSCVASTGGVVSFQAMLVQQVVECGPADAQQ